MSDSQNRMLLIVDPQIDFITGSLPVPSSERAMDDLAHYVCEQGKKYTLICVTCDHHPLCHSSFTDLGGIWPIHCVESTIGAAVWPPLMNALRNKSEKTHFLYKGQDTNKDEYSIFQSVKGASEMDSLIKRHDISDIDICGLAGDVCVANTLKDAISLYPDIHFNILQEYTASIDGGKLLSNL